MPSSCMVIQALVWIFIITVQISKTWHILLPDAHDSNHHKNACMKVSEKSRMSETQYHLQMGIYDEICAFINWSQDNYHKIFHSITSRTHPRNIATLTCCLHNNCGSSQMEYCQALPPINLPYPYISSLHHPPMPFTHKNQISHFVLPPITIIYVGKKLARRGRPSHIMGLSPTQTSTSLFSLLHSLSLSNKPL